jgi:hypothetical protein
MSDNSTSQGDDETEDSADSGTSAEAARDTESGDPDGTAAGRETGSEKRGIGREQGTAEGADPAERETDLDERHTQLDERNQQLDKREADLDRRGNRLDQREDGLDKRATDLQDRAGHLDQREEELEDVRSQLEAKREELSQRDARIEEHEAELDERESAIAEREEELSQRAAELDRTERTLQEYVGDQVAEMESSMAETVRDAVSTGMSQYDGGGSRLGTVGNLLLGLVGIALVVGGVVNGLPILWGFEALLVGNETGLVVSVLLVFFGLAANLAAAASRV